MPCLGEGVFVDTHSSVMLNFVKILIRVPFHLYIRIKLFTFASSN